MNKIILPLIGLLTIFNPSFSGAQLAPMSNQTAINNSVNEASFNDQSVYFVSRNGIRVRSAPDASGKTLGQLNLNDKVKVINPSVIYPNNIIEISIIKSEDDITKSERYFMSLDYLSEKIVDYKEFTGKYFVVVNVATETLRVYERNCVDNSCGNKMVMETEVVVGEDVDHPADQPGKGRSVLGSFRVVGWTKFYEDGSGHYPAWYKEGYPDVPKPGKGRLVWFEKRFMPRDEHGNREGHMRGAFGWYTAFVGPEPMGQWLHGTVGWGSDKDRYVKASKQLLANIFGNPRSSGCTRNNNEAIAFIRTLIEVGAPMIKIYAKEDILDPSLSNYPTASKDFNYVLTKNKDHAVERSVVLKSLGITNEDLDSYLAAKEAGGDLVLDPKSPLSQIIEAGTYQVDTHPDVIAYTEKMGRLKRSVGRKGNVYGIPSAQMHGTFYIDSGLLENYAHPETVVEVSGFKDEVTPSWMLKR